MNCKRRLHKKDRPPSWRTLCRLLVRLRSDISVRSCLSCDTRAAPRWRRGAVSLQITGDGAERGGQVGADGAEHGDGGNRDQGGNQTIFDGGGAATVAQQTVTEAHLHAPGPS